MRTNAQLKKFAKDFQAGKIFCDQMVQKKEDIPMVFLPIAIMSDEDSKKVLAKDPAIVYEYLSEKQTLSWNGMPTFNTCQFLSCDELKKVCGYIEEITEFFAKFDE